MVKKTNYEKITKRIRYLMAGVSLVPLIVFLFTMIFKPTLFVASDLFIVYFITLCFTFPSLIAYALFKKPFLSVYTVLAFLIYPAIYLVSLFIANLLAVQVVLIINIVGVLFLFAWHALTLKYILQNKFEHIDESVTGIILTLIPFIIYMFFISFVRDYGSIISTDILVHKTVLNGMETIKQFSIMPAGYSNMFTDQGYPVIFYHTFLFFINDAFNLSFTKVAYYIDFVFTFVISLTLFKLYFKYFKSYGWAILATTLTVLTFENLAYTTQYFIPQTLAFWFFLQIISEKIAKFKDLLLAIVLLITTHLFMGTYLAILLILKVVALEKYGLTKKLKTLVNKINIPKCLTLILVVAVLLSFAGFSIEETFQASTLKDIGIISNPAFWTKFTTIGNIFGFDLLFIIPIAIWVYKEKLNSKRVQFAFIAALIALIMYFLAPTFAAKFFLGFGFLIITILITFLSQLEYRKRIFKYILAVLLILSFGVNFIQQYNNTLPFLKQEDGTVSGVNNKDKNLVNYWLNLKPNCLVISDPETQIEIHALGEGNSARGYYMTLESRNLLTDFIRNPVQENLNPLYNLQEVPNKSIPLCIAVTSRLNDLVNDYNWIDVIYTYNVDSTEKLSADDKAVKFLKDSNFKQIYSDDYTSIFQIR